MGSVTLLVGFILGRTTRYDLSPASLLKPVAEIAISEIAAERLARAVRIPTISNEDPDEFDAASFRAMHRYSKEAFPQVHSQLQREIVATHSLLYTWQGR